MGSLYYLSHLRSRAASNAGNCGPESGGSGGPCGNDVDDNWVLMFALPILLLCVGAGFSATYVAFTLFNNSIPRGVFGRITTCATGALPWVGSTICALLPIAVMTLAHSLVAAPLVSSEILRESCNTRVAPECPGTFSSLAVLMSGRMLVVMTSVVAFIATEFPLAALAIAGSSALLLSTLVLLLSIRAFTRRVRAYCSALLSRTTENFAPGDRIIYKDGRSGKVVKVHHDAEGLYYTINVGGREIQAEDKSLRRPSVAKPILVLGVAAVGLYYTSLPVVFASLFYGVVFSMGVGQFYLHPVVPPASFVVALFSVNSMDHPFVIYAPILIVALVAAVVSLSSGILWCSSSSRGRAMATVLLVGDILYERYYEASDGGGVELWMMAFACVAIIAIVGCVGCFTGDERGVGADCHLKPAAASSSPPTRPRAPLAT